MNEYDLIQSVSHLLENFTKVSNDKFQFRCPFCGDGKNGKTKKRGAFINVSNSYVFTCLNCGDTTSMIKAVMRLDYDLYKEFRYKSYIGKLDLTQDSFSEEVKEPPLKNLASDKSIFDDFTPITELGKDHEVIKYLASRKIPKSKTHDLLYTDNFNKIAKRYSKRMKAVEFSPALVFPLITYNGIEFGFQARYLSNDSFLRYNTIMVDKRFTKAYGQHLIKDDIDINVTEGAPDSMFFKNGMATLDSSLHRTCDKLPFDKEKFVLWFDNEPSNNEIMKLKGAAIEEGFRVAFYNDSVKRLGKDINEMMLKSYTKKTHDDIMSSTIESGMKAKMLLMKERRKTI